MKIISRVLICLLAFSLTSCVANGQMSKSSKNEKKIEKKMDKKSSKYQKR